MAMEENSIEDVGNPLDSNTFIVLDECNETETEDNNTSDANKTSTPAFIKKPFIHVAFNDRFNYEQHRESFLRFLKSLKFKSQKNIVVNDNSEFYTIDVVADKNDVNSKSMFMVDTTPNSKKASVDVPCYAEKFDVLDHESKETSEKKKISRSRTVNTCFNCDGAHAIKDCPKPRNQSKINKARDSFNNKRAERYHCDIEQKFGHLKPGQLSDRLREALGLGKNELPMHTYVMRSIGYPPGWLEDAKITNSGLALFDSLGQPVLGSDEDEGEVEGMKYKYDTTKLIDFPGFNVEPPRGTTDKSNKYGFSPMMPYHRKEALIKSLQGSIATGYKRRKLKMNESFEDNGHELTAADMEIEDSDDDVIPLGVTVVHKSRSRSVDGEEKGAIGDIEKNLLDNDKTVCEETENHPENPPSRIESPTIEALKRRKQEILAEIGESSVFLDTSEVNSTIVDTTVLEDSKNESTEDEPQQKVIKTDYGAPIFDSVTPFSKLPTNEQFSKGVSDVINFENLPDSTGKYEKMRSLITKVRECVAKINSDV